MDSIYVMASAGCIQLTDITRRLKIEAKERKQISWRFKDLVKPGLGKVKTIYTVNPHYGRNEPE